MKIYRVGGSVRDQLLNLVTPEKPHEKDWLVVGATPEEMKKLKFKPVGKDFPVFLHPQSHEEYALARTERKTGKGYTQFTFHASPDVTLEEDLKRRDLTINAIAIVDETGEIIDPYNGQKDLKNKLLKHVSEAFIEDPVRILRVARFLARFYYLDFKIAPETQTLMKIMVENGEVDALVSDRVWQELDRALGEKNPEKFFEVLAECGALEKLFDNLMDYKINFQINSPKKAILFAHLFLTKSLQNIEKFSQKYPVPSYYKELAVLANTTQDLFSKKLNAQEIIDLLEKIDAYRRPDRFEDVLIIFESSPQIQKLKTAYELTKIIDIEKLQKQGLEGKALGEAIYKTRIEKLKDTGYV